MNEMRSIRKQRFLKKGLKVEIFKKQKKMKQTHLFIYNIGFEPFISISNFIFNFSNVTK
jgi:hypothetical protein